MEPWPLSVHYRDVVVREVLEQYQQVAPAAKRSLEATVQREVKVKGFLHPMKAPIGLLLREVVKTSSCSNAVLRAVLRVWLEVHKDLREVLGDFLNARGIFVTEDLPGAVEAFQSQYTKFGENDITLMLHCIKVLEEPLPTPEESTQREESAMKWQQWLEELQALPADSPEWEPEEIDKFVEAIWQLAASKRQEREAPREQLRLTLASLAHQPDDIINYFRMSEVSSWTADTCEISETVALEKQVAELNEALIKHQYLRQQPDATELYESRRRRDELTALENTILETYEHLSTVFGSPPPDVPPTEPEQSSHEEQEHQKEADPSESSISSEPQAVETGETGSEPEKVLQALPEGEPCETEISIPEAERIVETPPKAEAESPSEENSLSEEQAVALPEDATVQHEPVSDFSSELRSSHEVATLLQSDDRDELWHALLWALIAEDDLPAAYWLSRSLNASGRYSPMPDYLLKAAQGSRWLMPDDEEGFVSDLLDIAKTTQPTSDDVQTLIGLAASLRPALIAPGSGMLSWLKIPSRCPELQDLIIAVKEFAKSGIALRPEDLDSATGAEQYEDTLDEIVRAAQQWLQEAPGQQTTLRRASKVWHHLVGPKGELRELLFPVSKDSRGEMEKVREHLDQWQQENYVSNRIHQIDRQLVGRKPRPIDGAIHKRLIRNVRDACLLARRWCDRVGYAREIGTGGNWRFDQVDQLRRSVQSMLPKVETALGKLGQPARLAAAARCLSRAVTQLDETLNLKVIAAVPSMPSWEWFTSGSDDLSDALRRRLLWFPDLSVGDDGQPQEESQIAKFLVDACKQERSLSAAFRGWVSRQDYRFAERIRDGIRDETDFAEMSRHYQDALEGSREALRDRVNKTSEAIEQAVVDGIIEEEERSKYNADVVTVRPEEVLNFPSQSEKLRYVDEALTGARKKRLLELREGWGKLKNQLEESHNIEPVAKKHIIDTMTIDFEHEDTRVIEERTARLTELLVGGGDPKDIWSTRRDILVKEFQPLALEIRQWLEQSRSLRPIIQTIGRGLSGGGIRFAEVPTRRRDESIKAIEAWTQLKKQRLKNLESLQPLITSLMAYLGFNMESRSNTDFQNRKKGEDWLYVRINMATVDLPVPVPQFGSQAQGHYDVICLWERPGAEVIAARLRELGLTTHNVLMLYLGRLTERQQHNIIRTCREQELALSILDETLLIFLAQERDARLPVFLHCALPLTALNPYTPFQAGDVPPEMFFGREGMVGELQRSVGSCLVYGGRQLGKSALLRHVQRQAHHPERGEFAWVEDMKLVFDPDAGKDSAHIWRVLRDGFKRMKLFQSNVTTDRPEHITRHIRDTLQKDAQRRVIVMFDEADDFLDEDSRYGFRVVLELRKLMLDTERRFKVIFAGLHNVQRFQGIPNQPLAHFGAPLRVGPLEPKAAQELVQEPLKILGYRFVDDANVLRILSYTNYHPGLIQIFCQELLKRLHSQTGRSLPPYLIEQKHVEDVYRLPEVRERIRERFDWTLALDLRYQAIVWAVIFDQMGKGNIYASAYPPSVILELVRDWWGQGFGDMTSEQLRSLLDELCGLGVLISNIDGHYRLRSPNLVRLMGTKADIENRLLELSQKEPPRPFDADSHHAPLDDAAREYSPLSYAQERSLIPQQFGVGLICASEAMGLSALPRAFNRYIPADLAGGVYTEIPADITDSEKLNTWLGKYLQTNKGYQRLVVCYRPLGKAQGSLENLVRTTLDFCRRHRSRTGQRWLRVLFLFDPSSTWAWLSLHQERRKRLEDRMEVVWPPRWNLSGIRRRLDQHDKMCSEDICQSVLDETGGWPLLLDALFDRCDMEDNPRAFAKKIGEEVAQSDDSALGRRFRGSLGLNVNEVVRRVWEFICREDQVPVELITSDMFEGEPVLSSQDCAKAVEYLRRMGCISIFKDMISAEATAQRAMSLL